MNFKDNFSYFKNNSKEIYFDSAATSIKFDKVVKAQSEYDLKIGANTHNNLFDNAYKANQMLLETRQKIADFIGVKDSSEIIFTSGTTHSLNQLAFGMKSYLKKEDEILVTKMEHSSNLLPWMVLSEEYDLKLDYLDLDENFLIDLNKIEQKVNQKTKVVSFAMNSNTTAGLNDVENIVKKIKEINKEVIVILDLAQSIAHNKIDVEKLNVDCIAFSTHKLYGPFGLGVLWAKKDILKWLKPIFYGGGNNTNISVENYKLAPIPEKFEAGTLNLSAIYAFNVCLDLIEEFKLENLISYEKELKVYFREKLKQVDTSKFDFYNLENDQPIVLFNLKNVNSQDFGAFLNKKYNISVRVGKHCARLANDLFKISSTIRASFSIYNTKEDIDVFIEALKDCDNWINEII
ncbi:aminotransferase class V-fold PLP-dependent enzyme [Spiroplasma sp. BIUS-1]|uniref:aminotransferase class V-fold PLP-dependent enzyme n=1 Tax=Spiroplasma sp. BIUS-1 TaxID=216964 RepID=UPI00139911D9|nr:aminotransferase class V-fold PLP-dependent enzyme [Spiroplasma sp. BIUS-1]QHX36885.1 cysteine desulfurase [Spiroplasma sp. BIUS-1]